MMRRALGHSGSPGGISAIKASSSAFSARRRSHVLRILARSLTANSSAMLELFGVSMLISVVALQFERRPLSAQIGGGEFWAGVTDYTRQFPVRNIVNVNPARP